MKQLDEYIKFNDLGKHGIPPCGYKTIKVCCIYAIKHDIRHKERCVTDEHLTVVPLDSVYSGLMSLRGLHTMIFLARLNHLDTYATCIGYVYIESQTSEQGYIIAEKEFGKKEEQQC